MASEYAQRLTVAREARRNGWTQSVRGLKSEHYCRGDHCLDVSYGKYGQVSTFRIDSNRPASRAGLLQQVLAAIAGHAKE